MSSDDIHWKDTVSQPTALPVSSTAIVDGFKLDAKNDGSWMFVVQFNDVKVYAIGGPRKYGEYTDEDLVAAKKAVVSAMWVLRKFGAKPQS